MVRSEITTSSARNIFFIKIWHTLQLFWDLRWLITYLVPFNYAPYISLYSETLQKVKEMANNHGQWPKQTITLLPHVWQKVSPWTILSSTGISGIGKTCLLNQRFQIWIQVAPETFIQSTAWTSCPKQASSFYFTILSAPTDAQKLSALFNMCFSICQTCLSEFLVLLVLFNQPVYWRCIIIQVMLSLFLDGAALICLKVRSTSAQEGLHSVAFMEEEETSWTS